MSPRRCSRSAAITVSCLVALSLSDRALCLGNVKARGANSGLSECWFGRGAARNRTCRKQRLQSGGVGGAAFIFVADVYGLLGLLGKQVKATPFSDTHNAEMPA